MDALHSLIRSALVRVDRATSGGLPYDPDQVTPGVIGFVAILVVACAAMLLMWDFNRRVRRINDRADARARLEAEAAGQPPIAAGAPEGASAEAGGSDAAAPPEPGGR